MRDVPTGSSYLWVRGRFRCFRCFCSEITAKGDAYPAPGLLFLLFFAVWRTGERTAPRERANPTAAGRDAFRIATENKSPPNGGNQSVNRIAELCYFSNFVDA